MIEKYDVFWPTQQELTDLLQKKEIKGPLDKISLSEIYRRQSGEAIHYQELGAEAQKKFMQTAAGMARAVDCTIVFYNPKHRVSTTTKAIIIALNFELYQAK